MLEIRTHGRGGQGVVTYGDILAQAGLNEGYFVQTLPFFGVERRGASIRGLLRLNNSEIKKRSQCLKPDILVIFNANQLKEGISLGDCSESILILNSDKPVESKKPYWLIDANAIAGEFGLSHGDEVFINIVMAGAVAKVIGLAKESVSCAIETIRGVNRENNNIKAALKAYENVKIVGGEKHEA